jgi:uncharacterized protein DUF6864
VADFQARSGPATVLTSGTITAFNKNPIEISFGSPTFTLIFNFVDEIPKVPTVPLASRITAKVHEPLKVEFTFFNFTNPLGTGNGPALPIGVLADLLVYLNYRVYSLVGGDKTIQFTVYALEKPEAPKPGAAS